MGAPTAVRYYRLLLYHGWEGVVKHIPATIIAVLGAFTGVIALAIVQINPPSQNLLRTVAGVSWPLLLLVGYFLFYVAKAPWKIHQGDAETIKGLQERLGSLESSHAKGQDSWWDSLAAQDEAAIDSKLDYVFERCHCDAHLDSPEPYVDVSFWLINLSVYDLLLDSIDGRVTLGKHGGLPFGRALEQENGNVVLKRGSQRELLLRQWVTPQVSEQIKNSAIPTVLGTGKIGFNFTFQGHSTKMNTVRKAFPDDMFRILPKWDESEGLRFLSWHGNRGNLPSHWPDGESVPSWISVTNTTQTKAEGVTVRLTFVDSAEKQASSWRSPRPTRQRNAPLQNPKAGVVLQA